MKGYFDDLPDGGRISERILRGPELPGCDGFHCLGGQTIRQRLKHNNFAGAATRENLIAAIYACFAPPRNAETAFDSSVKVGMDCISRVNSKTSRTCPVGFSNFSPPP
jgi:hypothetical protein